MRPLCHKKSQRANHIDFSIVKMEKITGDIIAFPEIDMLDGPPLLDINPYNSLFDSKEKVKSDRLDKHFKKAGF
ncbi:MAG: TrmO family methyltransferase [Candidatus Ratteibacteria bacterium]